MKRLRVLGTANCDHVCRPLLLNLITVVTPAQPFHDLASGFSVRALPFTQVTIDLTVLLAVYAPVPLPIFEESCGYNGLNYTAQKI